MLLMVNLDNWPSCLWAKFRTRKARSAHPSRTCFRITSTPVALAGVLTGAVSVFISQDYGCGQARLLLAYFACSFIQVHSFLVGSEDSYPRAKQLRESLGIIFFSPITLLCTKPIFRQKSLGSALLHARQVLKTDHTSSQLIG